MQIRLYRGKAIPVRRGSFIDKRRCNICAGIIIAAALRIERNADLVRPDGCDRHVAGRFVVSIRNAVTIIIPTAKYFCGVSIDRFSNIASKTLVRRAFNCNSRRRSVIIVEVRGSGTAVECDQIAGFPFSRYGFILLC